MEITIDWILKTDKLQGLRCVAGESNISNKVARVNVLDNYDVLGWIDKNEFNLTTGFSFKDSVEKQNQIIRDLKLTGSSGLGIKINRFFDKIPQHMIDTANEVGYPIIEIPYFYHFAEITSIVSKALHEKNYKEKQDFADILVELSQMYYNNAGFEKMLKFLSESIDAICIVSKIDKVIFYNIPESKINNMLDNEKISIFQSKEMLFSHDKDEKVYYNLNENQIPFKSIPFPNGTTNFLVDHDICEQSIDIIKKCIFILSLELENSKNITNNISNSNYYTLFYDTLLDLTPKTPSTLKTIFEYYGFDYDKKRVCITISLKNEHIKNVKLIFEQVKEYLNENNISHFISFHLNNINVFVYLNHDEIPTIAVSKCADLSREIFNFINNNLSRNEENPSCIIGISRCHSDITTISTSLQDSVNTIKLMEKDYLQKNISTYFSKMPMHILSSLDKEVLEKIYSDSIKQLADFDKETNSELVITLRTYFDNKFNATETAKKLFLHRNTLNYRLEKIKSLLCIDLNEAEDDFSLYLAICAMDLLI